MNIWQLDPAQITPYYNIALCDALAQAGHDVTYFASQYLYDTALQLPDTFQTEYLYFRGLNQQWLLKSALIRRVLRGISYPAGHLALLRHLNQKQPDVLHVQWSRLPSMDFPLIQRFRQRGIPVVHTIHDVLPLFNQSARDGLHRLYQNVDALIVHAQANRQDFLQTYPDVDAAKIFKLPMITTENHRVPADASQQRARDALKIPQNVPLLGFFGAIKSYKGLDILLESYQMLLRQQPDCHLLIAGRPDNTVDTALIEQLRDMPQVHLHDRYIAYDVVWQYHFAVDLMVFPYRHIYQSAALSTAMEFGCAVIVTDVGGLPELVDDNGLVVPSENPDALATAMIDLIDDKERLADMRQRSRQIVAEQLSGQAVATRLLQIYETVLEQ